MHVRRIYLQDIGLITLCKRRGTRSIRLSVDHSGTVRVTLPKWAPYRLGIMFAEQRRSWLIKNKPEPQILTSGCSIGKAHILRFKNGNSSVLSARVSDNFIDVFVPPGLSEGDRTTQDKAREACVRGLKNEAKAMLPPRLAMLAQKNEFNYRSVKIKQMRSRWGSCSPAGDIVLNCYLMQMPWELIDYVLLHELLHTKISSHGPTFWDQLAVHVPDLPLVRKSMRQMRPTVSLGA